MRRGEEMAQRDRERKKKELKSFWGPFSYDGVRGGKYVIFTRYHLFFNGFVKKEMKVPN